ncbi:MAG: PASTA domain-containing protein [Chloroflexota bacterium]|nr:PASTA domain-containing protein [Chloroflexota bacterium]
MTGHRRRRRWAAVLARTPRRPTGQRPRVPVVRRPAPESRTASPRVWLLLSVIAAGAVAFSLILAAIGNPVEGVDDFFGEAQFLLAPEPEAANTGELLVPRADDSRASLATVPELTGLTRAVAEAAATDAEFRIVFDEDFNETVAEGLISRQTPEAGSRHDTSEPIRATLSLGRPQAAVPSVVGLSAAAARARLEAGGFQVLEVAAFSQDVPADHVLRQDPIAGSVINRRSAVVLHLSRGVETVTVPPLSGRSEDDARRAVELAGLVVGEVAYKETGSVPNGVVESQDPEPGASLARGGEVALTVVRVGEIEVPELRGLSTAAAERELLDRGLFIGELTRLPTGGVADERVMEQEPGAGAQVPRGFSVRLTVAIPGGVQAEPPSG